MSISRMNQIGLEKGLDAAIIYAKVAMIPYPIRKKLESGEWVFGKQPKRVRSVAKPAMAEVRTPVDRVGDKRLVKVTLGRDFLGYQLEVMGESGKVISTEGLGKLSLAEARALIGKSISHPMPANAGKKTNDPSNMCPKGASGGGSGKGGQIGGKKGKGK